MNAPTTCPCCRVELTPVWNGAIDRELGGALTSTEIRRNFEDAVRFSDSRDDAPLERELGAADNAPSRLRYV